MFDFLKKVGQTTHPDADTATTQKQKILAHLKHGFITQRIATNKYGILRLAPRILELKKAGHPITTRYARVGNQRWAVYEMGEQE